MASVIQSNLEAEPGALVGFDLSGYIESAAKYLAVHKARVIADGGYIPDENKTLDEFNFIIDKGVSERISAYPFVSGGVKVDNDGNVLKVYSLFGPDFIPVMVAGSASPLPTIKLDSSGEMFGVRITLNNGGYYLRSEIPVVMQKSAGKQWLLSGRMKDYNLLDSAGITIGWGVGSATYAFMETRKTAAISNPWKYVCTHKLPVAAGSYVAATQTPYADFVHSAGLFDSIAGKVFGYQDGSLAQVGSSDTGVLADMTGLNNYLWIGPTYLAQAGGVNVCDGIFSVARCMSMATEKDAIALSSRA